MCGIVGFIQKMPVLNRTTLLRMRDTLVHRGPDGSGMEIWDEAGTAIGEGAAPFAGFGHRRLSIIDLTEAGHQPMSNEDGSVWITYNGEFYTFANYRAELEQQGHVFRSRCDTETIVHLFEEYGIERTLQCMNGMFAFGIYDARRKRLLLARDRTGQKPLYYVQLPGGGLLFASEIKALLASGQVDARRLDPIGMSQFWTFGYTHGARTVYEQIRQLPAGHWAEWCDGRLTLHEYWDCPFGVDVRTGENLDGLADELEALLCDAIRIRLISDVPIGLFLSGGIDSSLIAALSTRRLRQDLNSFTIAFSESSFDESPFAVAIARHLGIHNEVLLVDKEMQPALPAIARHFDMPFGDSSCIPTYFVSKVAKTRATVVLTGDAGDELFGGYNWYARGLQMWGGGKGGAEAPCGWQQRMWQMRLKLFGKRSGFALLARLIGPRAKRRLFAGELLSASLSPEIFRERREWQARVRGADLLAQMQYMDLKSYLADDILIKVDRMSMANALECRSPFLDYRIIEFAARLPREAKIDASGRKKRILTHLLARYLPERLFARPKQGFGVPWSSWCDAEMRRQFRTAWANLGHPWLRADAGDWLFPRHVPGPVHLQWVAFSMLHALFSQAVGGKTPALWPEAGPSKTVGG